MYYPSQVMILIPDIKSIVLHLKAWRAIGRDRRGRTFRLLLPKQASHPKTISRLFVAYDRIELPPHGPKPCVLTVIRIGNKEEDMGIEPTTVLPATCFQDKLLVHSAAFQFYPICQWTLLWSRQESNLLSTLRSVTFPLRHRPLLLIFKDSDNISIYQLIL